jgi:hypothetical protein
MVNARLTWDSNAGRVGCGPMPEMTGHSLWHVTADNRGRRVWDPDPWQLTFVNQVSVPRVDANVEGQRKRIQDAGVPRPSRQGSRQRSNLRLRKQRAPSATIGWCTQREGSEIGVFM